MKRPSSPSRWRTAPIPLVAVLVTAGLGSGCRPDEHVGRPCDLAANVTNDGTGTTILISRPVAECPSRICLGPAGDTPATGPLCTASCASNEDCQDGELGDQNDPSDTCCKTGFVCMWPTTVGRLACERLCVCRDLISEPPGGFQEPVVCQ